MAAVLSAIESSEQDPESMRRPAANREAPPKRGISRTAINFFVDLALLIALVALMWISVVVRFVFPRGTEATGWRLLGLGYDDWCGLQFGTVALLAALVVLHLMLHWTWVCGVVTSRLSRWRGKTIQLDDGNRTLYGVGLLIVILNIIGLLTAAAALMIHGPKP
jgi:hypothetical protein